MKRAIIIGLVIILGCQSEETKMRNNVELSIRKLISDVSFKTNVSANIIDLKVCSCKKVDQNFIDTTIILQDVHMKLSYYKELAKNQIEMARALNELHKITNGNDAKGDYTIDETLKEANRLVDSCNKYYILDSTITFNSRMKKDPNKLIYAKIFLKATFSKDGKSNNILDTIHAVYTSDMKLYYMNGF